MSYLNDVDSPPDVVETPAVPETELSGADRNLSEIDEMKARYAAALVTIKALRIRLGQVADELEGYRVDSISAQLVREQD